MPDIAFGVAAFKRDNGNLPPLRLVNMFAEPNGSGPNGQILLSRLPMVQDENWGASPVDGLFQKEGVFGGDRFAVIGNKLYREGVDVGTVTGTVGDPIRFAATRNELVLTRSGFAYSYNGTNTAAVALPDGDRPVTGFRSVTQVAGLFIYVTITDPGSPSTPDHYWFWSEINDGRTIDDLDFAAAESEPDALLDALAVGDALHLFGQTSGEVWILNGAAALPFSRISQRNYGRGVFATGCAEMLDNTTYFVGNDRMVFRLEDVPVRISDFGLEEQIRKSATCSCFKFGFEGHAFFCIRLDSGTWAIDVSTTFPTTFATYGRANWAAKNAITVEGLPYFGDDTTGKIWAFGEQGSSDCAAGAFERVFPAFFKLNTQPQGVINVLVDANAGATPLETGVGADPRLEMRYSRDGGNRWTDWRTASLGARGEYMRQARYGNCGYFAPPGGLFEFRLTEPAPLRVSGVRVNESLAGRGW